MAHVAATFTQAGFRWRNDDGNEATATYAAALNTAITLETAAVARCRIHLDETAGGAENNVSTQWQRQLNGGGWVNVTTSSAVVRAVTSTQGSLDGTATTQQISSGTFVSAEVTEDGLSDAVRPSFAGNEDTELELVFEVVDADIADEDTVELRVVRADGTLFDTYSQTPSLTVEKAASAIEGDGAFDAPASTFTGAGAVPVEAGGGFTATVPLVEGGGVVHVTAEGTFTAPTPQVSGSGGAASEDIEGDGTIVAPVPQLSGTANIEVAADGTFTTSAPVVAGSGDVPVEGTGTFTASTPTVAGAGDVPVEADGTYIVPAPTVSGSGNLGDSQITGEGNITAPAPVYAGLGVVAIDGDGAALAPAPVIAGAGTVESGAVGGDGAYLVPLVVVGGVGGVEVSATGSFTAPGPVVSGAARQPAKWSPIWGAKGNPDPFTWVLWKRNS